MAKKIKRGRPPIGPPILIRVEPDIRKRIDKARGAQSVAEWARAAFLAALS